MVDYQKYIVINPSVRFGKPCLKGTRISVADVLGWLANNLSLTEILNDFPELTKEMVQACLAYAADKEHKTRIAS